MHSNGCNVAMTGLIIARLKEPSHNNTINNEKTRVIDTSNSSFPLLPESSVTMTPDEESWFGR